MAHWPHFEDFDFDEVPNRNEMVFDDMDVEVMRSSRFGGRRRVCDECGVIFDGIGANITVYGVAVATYCQRCLPEVSSVDVTFSDRSVVRRAHYERLGLCLYRTR